MIENNYNWISWWKTENITRDVNWRKNMDIFIKVSNDILKYNSDDIILDIGCGPCYLASYLKARVKEIHCLDISQRYLDICRKKLKKAKNIYFYKLNENNYSDLSFLKPKKFSKIICLSVIQYYKSFNEVEKIIIEVKQLALPDAKFLIADIHVSNKILTNLFGLFKTGITKKYLLESIKLLYRARTTDYQKIYSSVGLLEFSTNDLNKLINKLKLHAEILKTQITVNANRNHLLIKFY